MSTTDFNLPVAGVTGVGFRNNLSTILAALASTNESSADPPVTYPGMLQVKSTAGVSALRVRNAANSNWVTLLPDLSEEYGGIVDVVSAALPGVSLAGNNTFSGANNFTGNVTFTNVPAGLASDAELASAINTRTTPSQVNSQIASALSGLTSVFSQQYVQSFSFNFGGSYSFSHGMSAEPKLCSVEGIFQTNTLGYSVGDVIILTQGFQIRKTGSLVEINVGLAPIPVIRRDNGASELITNNNTINLRVRAFT